MTIKYKSFSLKVAEIDEAGRFEGYASIFNVIDKTKEIVLPGAFTKSLARWQAEGRPIKMLWQHLRSEPIGTLEAHEDEKGLRVAGTLLKGVRRSEEAIILMRAKAIDELSIGYDEVRAEDDGQQKVRKLIELDLREVSPVTFAALPVARIDQVKGERQDRFEDFARRLRDGEPPETKEFEDILREAGVPKSMAVQIASVGYAKAIRSESDGPEVTMDLSSAHAAVASLRQLAS